MSKLCVFTTKPYAPDSNVISYKELLEVLWHTHDPTTLNRQGNDVAISSQCIAQLFFTTMKNKISIAEESLVKTDTSGLWNDPIVTNIEPLTNYYVKTTIKIIL